MPEYLRLRQVCLAAPRLAPVVDDLQAIFKITVCHRDPGLAAYGLQNALMPIGNDFLEVVAPLHDDTAAGRFIARTRGHGGYMAIFQVPDPRERQAHAAALGVRTAHEIARNDYQSAQLHPRDCRAAFIEFNHTDGSDDILGPYPPAGPDWQKSIRKDTTLSLTEVEMQSPEPEGLAAHWGRIIGIPANGTVVKLANSTFRFVKGDSEIMSGLTFKVADKAKVLEAAKARGCAVKGDEFQLCGVTFKLTA